MQCIKSMQYIHTVYKHCNFWSFYIIPDTMTVYEGEIISFLDNLTNPRDSSNSTNPWGSSGLTNF